MSNSAMRSGRLLLGNDVVVSRWVAKRLGFEAWVGSHVGIGVLNKTGNVLIAGVVFHGYDGNNIFETFAADTPSWCRRGILKALFDYPFEQLGCRRITSVIDIENERSIRVTEGLGFKREGILREGGQDGRDAILLSLLKSERKF